MLSTIPITEVSPKECKDFVCGIQALDEYLKRYARGNHRKNIGKTFVFIQDQKVVGYYSLSMGSIEFQLTPKTWQSKLPRYPIPIARIGRLAVINDAKGQGIGKLLLIDAFYRIQNASTNVAAYAVIVDAKDENAAQFYSHFGFISFENEPLTLFLPLATLEESLSF